MSLKLSSLFLIYLLIFCWSDGLGDFHCFVFKFTDPFFALSNLLLNLSSVFSVQLLYSAALTSVLYLFIFLTLCWNSHCVHLFFSWVLWAFLWPFFKNSLTGKLLIFVSLRVPPRGFYPVPFGGTYSFLSSFCLTLYVDWYALDETTTCHTLEALSSCRRWILSFSPVLALCCLANLCNCPSNLFYI